MEIYAQEVAAYLNIIFEMDLCPNDEKESERSPAGECASSSYDDEPGDEDASEDSDFTLDDEQIDDHLQLESGGLDFSAHQQQQQPLIGPWEQLLDRRSSHGSRTRDSGFIQGSHTLHAEDPNDPLDVDDDIDSIEDRIENSTIAVEPKQEDDRKASKRATSRPIEIEPRRKKIGELFGDAQEEKDSKPKSDGASFRHLHNDKEWSDEIFDLVSDSDESPVSPGSPGMSVVRNLWSNCIRNSTSFANSANNYKLCCNRPKCTVNTFYMPSSGACH